MTQPVQPRSSSEPRAWRTRFTRGEPPGGVNRSPRCVWLFETHPGPCSPRCHWSAEGLTRPPLPGDLPTGFPVHLPLLLPHLSSGATRLLLEALQVAPPRLPGFPSRLCSAGPSSPPTEASSPWVPGSQACLQSSPGPSLSPCPMPPTPPSTHSRAFFLSLGTVVAPADCRRSNPWSHSPDSGPKSVI